MNRASTPWNWRAMSPDGARSIWDSLADWVPWLVKRYDLAELIPACWWRHPALIEELTALWVAWVGSYADASAGLLAPITWHERFAAARPRMAEWDRNGCARGQHRDPEVIPWDMDKEAYDAFVKQDLCVRLSVREAPADEWAE